MKRFKLLIVAFFLTLSIPLAYLVWHAYRGMEKEEVSTLGYFANALFDQMERELEIIVQREEGRAIDEYNYYYRPLGRTSGDATEERSPLSHPPQENYILGYFQNNPDGSFQTPLVKMDGGTLSGGTALVDRLKRINAILNQKRFEVRNLIEPQPEKHALKAAGKQESGFAEKYLDLSRSQKPKAYLGQKEKRVEEVTAGQALGVVKQEQPETLRRSKMATEGRDWKDSPAAALKQRVDSEPLKSEAEAAAQVLDASDSELSNSFQVEVTPLQSVFIDDNHIFIFRAIMVDNQIYRQGFVLEITAFLQYLAETFFATQPMAQYTNLHFKVTDQVYEAQTIVAGIQTRNPSFILNRTFPSPFRFLSATLSCDEIPSSAGRSTLNIMVFVLATIMLMGLLAIYLSARAIIDISERRSQFVSSVTHELKTPLTNLRMYIEMLEQGIARDQEREQEYFRILDSEGARLSRLISNVLELSKLEQKQRHVNLQSGTFEDVIQEVQAVTHVKLQQEGFILKVEQGQIQPFKYDREMMIQVLINLIENSVKFGKTADRRLITIRMFQKDTRVILEVSDTGPGIPRHALKKVFDDFYRVDNSLTRTTRGTGIGLALVKRFVGLMGGTVHAANNEGPGCTITISLPNEI